MMIYTVIPYLLGIIMQPNRTIDEGLLEYTFQVDIKWWFSDFKQLKENIYLSVDLKCHQAENDLSCRFEKYKVRQRAKIGRDSMLPDSFYIERPLDQEALQRNSRPFQITYNYRGIAGYYLEGHTVPKRVMNLYRIIGNQLNVGFDLESKDDAFEDLEQSNMGYCFVTCTTSTRDPPFNGPIANLTSFVGWNLAHNTITILKQRIIQRCAVLSRRSVTASFWPDFFPQTAVSHVLTKSESSMTMSSRNFDTLTENEYKLYDERNRIVGDMTEKVEVYLKSYRLLPPDDLITLNEDKIVFYSVSNDDTA